MNRSFKKQRGANLLEYAVLISLVAMISIGAVMRLGKQTKRPSCLVIGAFVDPESYGTGTAATKWDQSTQSCKKSDGWGGYEPFF